MATSTAHIGVDVGGTKVMAVALAADRTPVEVLAEATRPTPRTAQGIIGVVGDAIDDVVGLCGRRPRHIGVGLAGYVDLEGIARAAPNLAAMVGVDVAGPLRDRFGVEVGVDNDANCAARCAVGLDMPEVGTMVMVTLGTGIGGALVVGGEVVGGARGFAGEVGHMIVEANGPLCVCGLRGCWERRASGSALTSQARTAAAEGRGRSLLERAGSADAVNGPMVTSLAADGDPEATAILGDFAWWVALGIVNLVNIVDPEFVVLGGGLVATGDPLLSLVRSRYSDMITTPIMEADRIVIGTAGSAAGAIGAALLAGSRSRGR